MTALVIALVMGMIALTATAAVAGLALILLETGIVILQNFGLNRIKQIV